MDNAEQSDGWEAFIPMSPEQARMSAARNTAIVNEAWKRLQEGRD